MNNEIENKLTTFVLYNPGYCAKVIIPISRKDELDNTEQYTSSLAMTYNPIKVELADIMILVDEDVTPIAGKTR